MGTPLKMANQMTQNTIFSGGFCDGELIMKIRGVAVGSDNSVKSLQKLELLGKGAESGLGFLVCLFCLLDPRGRDGFGLANLHVDVCDEALFGGGALGRHDIESKDF